MTNRQFGTDGIRGPYGIDPITPEGAEQFGLATAAQLHALEVTGDIVLGRDTRASGSELAAAMTIGLTQGGFNVKDLGVVPSPAVAQRTLALHNVAAGVVLTASHNPAMDNGYKLYVNGAKPSQEFEEQLAERFQRQMEPATSTINPGTRHELAVTDPEGLQGYVNFLISQAHPEIFHGMRMVIDTANGAASNVAERVFTALGAEVMPIFDQPDGHNINRGCGATALQALTERTLREENAIGIAFDGDADRVFIVDEQGRTLNGDHFLAAYATLGKASVRAVVGTIMTNQGLENYLSQHDIALIRADVGDKHISRIMRTEGLPYGGEPSGHLITPGLPTGDGMLSAIHFLDILRQQDVNVTDFHSMVPMLPEYTQNFVISPKQRARLSDPDVGGLITEYQDASKGRARIIVRASGTEDVLRVTFQGENPSEKTNDIGNDIFNLF